LKSENKVSQEAQGISRKGAKAQRNLSLNPLCGFAPLRETLLEGDRMFASKSETSEGPSVGLDLPIWEFGQGRPVVLLHGFPMDHNIWDHQIQCLAPRYRVIAPDLRCFREGEAAANKITIQEWADGLATALDALKINEPIVLGGLSMGGYIAFQFFQTHRARLAGLILCDTRAATDTPQAATGRFETAARLEREGTGFLPEAMLPRLLAPATLDGKIEVVECLRRTILAGNAANYAAILRGLAERPDFTPLLSKIDCPTLLIVGRQDAISPAAEMAAMARAIPGARLVEIEAAGHITPLEAPEAVSRAMAEFLDVFMAARSSTGS
jgi:pimeloyl-ACP methyl ester carboxylesterase